MDWWWVIVVAPVAALLFLILLNLFVYFFQERLIFQGHSIDPDYEFSFPQDFKEYLLDTEEKGKISVLHFTVPEPVGAILYFHGNRADLRKWGQTVMPLTRYGYDVFVMDYRGYGKSRGLRTEAFMHGDAKAYREFVTNRFKYDRMVYFGRSLGSAFALHLAAHQPPDKLILETPIAHITNGIDQYHGLIRKAMLGRFAFDNLRVAPNVACDTVVLHGTNDRVVPLKFSRVLFDTIASKSKKIVVIPKGGHNNLNNFETYYKTLQSTLTNYESVSNA